MYVAMFLIRLVLMIPALSVAACGISLILVAPSNAAPLDDNAWRAIASHLAASATDARDGRAQEALNHCNAARAYAVRYDEDARIAGRIEMCFGLHALYRKDRIAACAAYARALPILTDTKFKDAQLDLDRAKLRNRELGC
jgi:ABC-type microcin C transport system permease subunit YejB